MFVELQSVAPVFLGDSDLRRNELAVWLKRHSQVLNYSACGEMVVMMRVRLVSRKSCLMTWPRARCS